jgi:hypothetical protein
MRHGPGEVEDPSQAGREVLRQMCGETGRHGGFGVIDQVAVARGLAGIVEQRTRAGEHRLATVFSDQGRNGTPVEDAINRGRTREALCMITMITMRDRQSLCS